MQAFASQALRECSSWASRNGVADIFTQPFPTINKLHTARQKQRDIHPSHMLIKNKQIYN